MIYQRFLREIPSKEEFERIFNETVKKVMFDYHKNTGIKGFTIPSANNKFGIVVNTYYSEQEQKLSLVHEFFHIYYEGQSQFYISYSKYPAIMNVIENIIDSKTQDFYSRNKEFVDNLYLKVKLDDNLNIGC